MSLQTVRVNAPAKINLTLTIEGVRDDGYHLLSSVFQSVSLADYVTVTRTADEGIALTMSDPLLPCDARNTAYRAALFFYEAIGQTPHASIYVEKIIPQQAGLGGGSADAAGVLVGLNTLYDMPLSTEDLCAVGEKVGADVPFCIVGGTAMVTGIGERIEPLSAAPAIPLVIAKPPIGVSTKEAYAAVDSVPTAPADQEAMCCAIRQGDASAIGRHLCNAFEQALRIPEVEALLEQIRAFSPYGAAMSGSGSAVYGLFPSLEAAKACASALAVEAYEAVMIPTGATVIGKD